VATRAMTSMLEGVTPTDPLTFTAVVIITGLMAIGASLGPARKAGKADPAKVLGSS
jgi:putative ABC transport system permease protein